VYRQNCLYRKIFQKIDSVLISRIGIILSTLGGFLVAPDLIGIKRIENFQNWLIRSAGFLRPPIENAHYWAQYDAAPENLNSENRATLITVCLNMHELYFSYQ